MHATEVKKLPNGSTIVCPEIPNKYHHRSDGRFPYWNGFKPKSARQVGDVTKSGASTTVAKKVDAA